MNTEESPATIVARFLRTNGYEETLDVFLKEANLPPTTGSTVKSALTIEQILQEKKLFDTTRAFEKLGVEEEETGWRNPSPSVHGILDTLPSVSNILHVSVESILDSNVTPHNEVSALLVTGADRSSNILSPKPPHTLLSGLHSPPSDAPILAAAVLHKRYLLTTSMSGKLVLSDLSTGKVLSERRDHQKYTVRVSTFTDRSGTTWAATAAWDTRVLLYRISGLDTQPSMTTSDCEIDHAQANADIPAISEPLASLTLPTNPDCILFIEHPEIATPVLLLSRRDSTFLYYYTITESAAARSGETKPIMTLLGRQNLAPHSNAWIAFTPSSFALHPRDRNLLAVATSAVPHMKLIIVRLLLPPPPPPGSTATASANGNTNEMSSAHFPAEPTTTTLNSAAYASASARAALALADREAAAIVIHATTMAPQTAYSTPALAWRPDGSGVWVNGDDGAVRGIETTTGKVIVTLTEGHEQGTKVRCLAAGFVKGVNEEEQEREVLISGGFDRRCVVWKVEEESSEC